MTGLVWFGIIAGLVIVALAVGIPYLLTHKRMQSPHDLAEGHAYIQGRRKLIRKQRGAAARSKRAASK